MPAHVEDRIKKRLEAVRCTEHGQRPRVTVSHQGRDPQYKIEGCCKDLVDKATRALR